MKNKFDFKIKNDFYYRYPYFSYNFYENEILNLNKNIIDEVREKYTENILISSKGLYDSLMNNINSKNRDISLYKYLLRSSVRTTPYGINAGVARGHFSNKNQLELYKSNKKKVRVDIEWLCNVIKKCEKELKLELRVKKGSCFYQDGNRIKKYYDSCYTKDSLRLQQGSSINNTSLVKSIFDLTKDNFVKIADVVSNLIEQYGEEKKDKIVECIFSLLENEYINSDLKINLLSNDPFADFLKNLLTYDFRSKLFDDVNNIYDLISVYNTKEIGTATDMYLSLIEIMKEVYDTNNYLQVDMYNESVVTLNGDIRNDIEEFANFFISKCINERYDNYVNKFREIYGEQAVKVIDVINSEIGLGIPKVDEEITKEYREWWITILFNYIINHKEKDYIDLSKINNEFPFKFDGYELKFPLSFELSFYILNDGNQFKYILSPMLGSERKWKSYGRFDYLFDESLIKKGSISREKGFKEVEVTFYPSKAHEANVTICNFNKPAYLEFNTNCEIEGKERINIDDIFMYIDKNSRISFVQGSTNEILSFSTTNKYITDAFPQFLKTLVEVEKNQKPCFESFFYAIGKIVGNLAGHIPEIRFKNIIISQECWKLDNNEFNQNGKIIKFDLFKDKIIAMVQNKKLPLNICTGPIDRKLILNLNKENDIKILYDMVKNTPNLQINKNNFTLDNLILKDKINNKYIGEFVFQFEQEEIYNDTLIYSQKRIPLINNYYIEKSKNYPFNNWTTLNLYINSTIENKLLTNQIKYLFCKLTEKKYIEPFFYIRYKDPRNHLRLRFKILENNQAEVISEINKLIKILRTLSLLNDISYTTYIPEINRYGGIKCYQLVEKVFQINSLISMNLIDMVDKKLCSLDKEDIFLIGSYKMIQDMGITDEELLEYIKRYKLDKKFNKLFRQKKDTISIFFNKDNINESFFDSHDFINLFSELDRGTKYYKEYWKVLSEQFNDNYFDDFIVKRYCLNSVLHMFFNRLIGIDRDTENVLMGFLEKLVYGKIQRGKLHGK